MSLQSNPGFKDTALASHQEDYEKIHDFLTWDQDVADELTLLDQNLSRRPGSDPCAKLWTELMEQEFRWGFSQKLAILTGALSAEQFLHCLSGRHPIKDPGANPFHGEYSHRIQWYMIANRYDRGELRLGTRPSELYKKMGNGLFLHVDRKTSLWDDLVDSLTAQNATAPEWLNKEVAGLPGYSGALQRLGNFPALTDACNTRYQARLRHKHKKTGNDRFYLRQLTLGMPEHVTQESDAAVPGDWALQSV